VLDAARDAGVRRVVYASSSAVYGDHPGLPKVEDATGRPLSPYAATKAADELYAHAFANAYGLETVGLRYFNVFGPRQDPAGAYAAVIPLWFAGLFGGSPPALNGDGETSRDFSYVANVVQANLLAATATDPAALRTVYNVAAGGRTTLLELFGLMREEASRLHPAASGVELERRPLRAGDTRRPTRSATGWRRRWPGTTSGWPDPRAPRRGAQSSRSRSLDRRLAQAIPYSFSFR
jgi:UDP-N-acetylglucosamine 4-epimerase